MTRHHRGRTYSYPGYTPPKRIAIVRRIFCICGQSFGSSRDLREHEARCSSVRMQRDLDTP